MNQLIWKAWREQRIYLVALMVLMLALTGFLLAIELAMQPRHPIHFIVLSPQDLVQVWVLYAAVAATVLAMTVACGERQSGSLWFSVSLPVSIRRYAMVRLVMGLAILLAPLLIVSCLIAIAVDFGLIHFHIYNARDGVLVRSIPGIPDAIAHLTRVTAIALVSTAQLYLLLCLAACWLRTPAKVALFGPLLTMALLMMVMENLPGELKMNQDARFAFAVLFPQSLLINDQSVASPTGYPLTLASIWLAGIGYLFTRFYGREPEPVEKIRSRWWLLAIPPWFSRWNVPLRSPAGAMIWLELRQAGPLVLCGLALSAMLAIYLMIPGRELSEWGANFQSALPATAFLFALLWATVVGTSLFSADLGDSLGGFWRSRPISPQVWFWCKYLVGLVALLVVIDGTTILISWNPPQAAPGPGETVGWAYLACVPLLHTFMYTAAVLGSCGLRRSGIGGVVAMVMVIVVTMAVQIPLTTRHLTPFWVFSELTTAEAAGQLSLMEHHYPLVYGTVALATLLMAYAASRLAAPLEPVRARLWLKLARG